LPLVKNHTHLTIKHKLLLLVHPFNSLFSRTTWVSQYQKGQTSLDLNEARDDEVWESSGISWTICKQSAPRWRDNHTNTSSLNFYGPDALPDAQPTVLAVKAYTINHQAYNEKNYV